MKTLEIATGIATLVMAVMSVIMVRTISQNSKALELSRKSLELSQKSIEQSRKQLEATLPPSLELTPSTNGDMTLFIKNTGSIDISDLKLYQVGYLIGGETVVYRRKMAQGPSFKRDSLRSGETTPVSLIHYFDTNLVSSLTESETQKRFLTIVLCYKRSVDQKPFIQVEPCYAFVADNGQLGIGFLQQADWTATDGPVSQIVEAVRKINETERLFFRMYE
jgi:hypothetical protein